MALTTLRRAVRTMERALMLRRRRCSDWRARFFADLMLAKVELRNAVLGLEKDANYAIEPRVRQLRMTRGSVHAAAVPALRQRRAAY